MTADILTICTLYHASDTVLAMYLLSAMLDTASYPAPRSCHTHVSPCTITIFLQAPNVSPHLTAHNTPPLTLSLHFCPSYTLFAPHLHLNGPPKYAIGGRLSCGRLFAGEQ